MSPEPLSTRNLPDLAPIDFDDPRTEGPPKGTACSGCSLDIRAIYYEAAGKVICPKCRNELASQLSPEGGRAGRFGKALGFGMLAAIAGRCCT